MLNAFGADQLLGNRLDCLGDSLNYKYLKTVIVIEVDVECGEDLLMMLVLHIRKLLAEHADVMVIHQSNGANYLAIGRLPSLLNQFLANQIAECFGPVGITSGGNQFVELSQQARIDGNSNPT
jgi:hypothetical protein